MRDFLSELFCIQLYPNLEHIVKQQNINLQKSAFQSASMMKANPGLMTVYMQ